MCRANYRVPASDHLLIIQPFVHTGPDKKSGPNSIFFGGASKVLADALGGWHTSPPNQKGMDVPANTIDSLSLVFDQETYSDKPLPGCQRTPVWWVPYSGIEHSGTTVGVRWRCTRCGVEGQGIFGPARDLSDTTVKAEKTFMNDPATRFHCKYFDISQCV